ncbi:barstar family protein [Enterococcus sp. RIT-PI-f]|uniref:barstar family protein n=1 Tax=Enterococcus sp. RIT-PI-f TaxID=1690244 RepID=UPI0009E9F0DF|nr:barstar family protein [Enterococcus sp. RIT-PI-f]
MIENKILRVNENERLTLENDSKQNNCYIVNIQGNNIQTKKEFLELMKKKFELPDSSGWDSYTDWMTDLSWIDNQCFCIVIEDYANFLKNDAEAKKIVIEIFEEDILPYWQKDVMKTVVDGKPRLFNVYLVE